MILFLELGVGGNTPGIIKYPFLRMTAGNPRAIYISVNPSEAFAPREAPERFVFIRDDAGSVLSALRVRREAAQAAPFASARASAALL